MEYSPKWGIIQTAASADATISLPTPAVLGGGADGTSLSTGYLIHKIWVGAGTTGVVNSGAIKLQSIDALGNTETTIPIPLSAVASVDRTYDFGLDTGLPIWRTGTGTGHQIKLSVVGGGTWIAGGVIAVCYSLSGLAYKYAYSPGI